MVRKSGSDFRDCMLNLGFLEPYGSFSLFDGIVLFLEVLK